jgi:hypothetical protein
MGDRLATPCAVGATLLRGKQWQTTPKNLPRMQRARAIPIA